MAAQPQKKITWNFQQKAGFEALQWPLTKMSSTATTKHSYFISFLIKTKQIPWKVPIMHEVRLNTKKSEQTSFTDRSDANYRSTQMEALSAFKENISFLAKISFDGTCVLSSRSSYYNSSLLNSCEKFLIASPCTNDRPTQIAPTQLFFFV